MSGLWNVLQAAHFVCHNVRAINALLAFFIKRLPDQQGGKNFAGRQQNVKLQSI
jgi:hypothetical protein